MLPAVMFESILISKKMKKINVNMYKKEAIAGFDRRSYEVQVTHQQISLRMLSLAVVIRRARTGSAPQSMTA